ncbi:hypothetical protein LTR70_008609 [Exophiala xenobiotica]|uniref:Glycoside hydrolase family 125 protein n=1 Tax=Lithohypha guttulata TaxID=1690604 RepID=A0ABR0K0W1_9EURO|nr:hypothetical protein LTR24_008318 [Lithohypha guttulata]KAK5311750.1 hypothetical protein LTR70_008609 [Exophiala xenobiotica]
MKSKISDPDLYRLFENSFPNTLDTAIGWRGVAANNSAEELTFIITGDINAMWLRDSSNQMLSYSSFLQNASTPVFASLYRGVLNLQARYIQTSPFCNSFQPPVESGINASVNEYAQTDEVYPQYSNLSVFECKYELDSLASFLELSSAYYTATSDLDFFQNFQWVSAVQTVLNVATAMRDTPTYAANGMVNQSPYTFQRDTTSASETLLNMGIGSPVNGGTALVRSAFRPSDDSTIYQLFIPANMQFATHLNGTSYIMSQLGQADLAAQTKSMSDSIRAAIEEHAVVNDKTYGQIYAFEIDGYGSANIMDDANIPSLLAAPLFGYTIDAYGSSNSVHQATRGKILSADNPYFMRGPVINAVGGPHQGPGMAWPMASIVRILTSTDKTEISQALREIVSSTDGLGLIHESINTFNVSDWTRGWFSWANGLFGQAIFDLGERMPEVLMDSYQ